MAEQPSKSSIQFIDPRAEPGQPIEPYELTLDADARPVSIGLLANGFPDSVNFLECVETSLAALLPDATFVHYNKRNVAIVVPDAISDEVVADCDAVIAAYGH